MFAQQHKKSTIHKNITERIVTFLFENYNNIRGLNISLLTDKTLMKFLL